MSNIQVGFDAQFFPVAFQFTAGFFRRRQCLLRIEVDKDIDRPWGQLLGLILLKALTVKVGITETQ